MTWTPTPRQTVFLGSDADECLFGGAAGGGKSQALLVDALGLQQNAILYPEYRAILFRRTFVELRELIDRSRELYPRVAPGARFFEAPKEWRFPSGAKVLFGHCALEADKYQYQGAEYQYIAWDELTHWSNPDAYDFLLTRLRSTNPAIKCYCRATTNPGGYGHNWVKERWRIPDDGSATSFVFSIEGRVQHREFVPARLSDNPHLADSGYRERLMQQSEQQQRYLLEGRWDNPEMQGAIYGAQFKALRAEGRICTVPIETSLPVNTFWDLGHNDSTSIWFHQRVGLENRFIDFYQANGEALAHYAKVLRDKGYLYGTHYLPHDAQVTELGSGKSRLSTLEDLGVRPISIVPRVQSVDEGIEMTRQAFASCWFDAQRCAPGLESLAAYRREWSDRHQTYQSKPHHDWASDAADAFRQFAQGFVPSTKARKRPTTAAILR